MIEYATNVSLYISKENHGEEGDKMKKYPVISESGNEYQVELFVGKSLALVGFNIVIKGRKDIFGIEYFETLRHYNRFNTEREMFEEFGDYIGIAKYYVTIYENEIKERNELKEMRNNYVKEFEEWDGRC